MQTQVKIYGSNANYFFANIEVSQSASNGGLVVIRDVKIPMTTTTHQLLNNYAVGQVLTLEQKNGEVVDYYFIENDGESYIFSTHP
ncbi:TPA: hypothetical protein ACWX51_000635 [Klebsiella pneumoniae]